MCDYCRVVVLVLVLVVSRSSCLDGYRKRFARVGAVGYTKQQELLGCLVGWLLTFCLCFQFYFSLSLQLFSAHPPLQKNTKVYVCIGGKTNPNQWKQGDPCIRALFFTTRYDRYCVQAKERSKKKHKNDSHSAPS